jgi:primary-amine oxidase
MTVAVKERTHPLDPLTAAEIQRACDLLKEQKSLADSYRFALVQLQEPDKPTLLESTPERPVDRQVFLLVFDTDTGKTFEAIVSLSANEIRHWKFLPLEAPPFGQPPVIVDEFFKCERIVKADKGWRAALKLRGLSDSDIENVQVDPISAGYFGVDGEKGRRLLRATSYYREDLKDNGYAHPIEGVYRGRRPDGGTCPGIDR